MNKRLRKALVQSERRRGAWMQGVIDREAGCAVEPRDFDIEQHFYAQEYEAGVRDYDVFKAMRNLAKTKET